MGGYPEKVARVAFDDTGRWFAADGSPDITIWDFSGQGPAGTAPRRLVTHARITTLAWRPGTHAQLASGGTEGTVALWEAAGGSPGGRIDPARQFALDAGVTALTWAGPDLLVAADRNGRIEALRLPAAPTR